MLYRQLHPTDPILTAGEDLAVLRQILDSPHLYLFVGSVYLNYKAMLQTGSKRESTHAFYRSCGFGNDEKTGYFARPGSR